MVNYENKGFVLVCKRSGALDSIIRDDYNIFSSSKSNFFDFFDSDNKTELINFLSSVHDFRSFFENTIKIKEKEKLANFYLAGAPYYNNAIIIGSSTIGFSDFFYEVKENLSTELADLDQIVDEKCTSVLDVENIFVSEHADIPTLEALKELLNLKEMALFNKTKELEQFAHIVSHDLKAPLSQSKLIVHLLNKKLQEEEYNKDITELFNMLILSTNHMSDLIDSIQLYSKSGFLVQELTHFNISDLIADVINDLNVPAEMSMNFEKDLPSIYGNKLHLQQVLSQLLNNAIKFHHKPDGNITVDFKEHEEVFNFEVIDDGPGIPEEYHQRIFEIFNKSTHRSDKVGTGVGLSIVKKIVESAGGIIVVDSKVGKGSNFKFIWPKCKEISPQTGEI